MANLDTLRGYNQSRYGEVRQYATTEYISQSQALGYQVLNEPMWNKGESALLWLHACSTFPFPLASPLRPILFISLFKSTIPARQDASVATSLPVGSGLFGRHRAPKYIASHYLYHPSLASHPLIWRFPDLSYHHNAVQLSSYPPPARAGR